MELDPVHLGTQRGLIHFPLILGIVPYAAAVEEALAHPADALAPVWRWSLAAGLMLYLGSMAVALIRATGKRPTARVAVMFLTAIVLVLVPGPAAVTLGIAFIGVAAIAVMEQTSTN